MSDAALTRPEPDPLARARRYVETHLARDFSLNDLARAAGLSAYHFTRQFSARHGFSPMADVRARRLEVAAERLRNAPGGSLIDLALDCGFDSQEGFTRAFTKAFGVPPGRYRSGLRPLRAQPLTGCPDAAWPRPNLIQAPTPARKPAMRIAGLSIDIDDDDAHRIPELWERFVPALPVAGQTGGGTFGVCAAGRFGKALHYLAGVEVAADAEIPDGWEVAELPARPYLVFRQVMDGGPLQPQMRAAVREIWGELAPNSDFRLCRVPDLEVYPEGFQPDRAGAWVEWWLPVEA